MLDRWSRRKQRARAAEPPATQCDAGAEHHQAVDLPAIEALGPASDYTVFMREGVPKALRLAALRKAWVTDPVISGHRTPAECDWDFNAPGYGALRKTDDPIRAARALLEHLMPKAEATAEDVQAARSVTSPDRAVAMASGSDPNGTPLPIEVEVRSTPDAPSTARRPAGLARTRRES